MVAAVPFPERPGPTCDDIGQWTNLWEDAWKQGNQKLENIRLWGLPK